MIHILFVVNELNLKSAPKPLVVVVVPFAAVNICIWINLFSLIYIRKSGFLFVPHTFMKMFDSSIVVHESAYICPKKKEEK